MQPAGIPGRPGSARCRRCGRTLVVTENYSDGKLTHLTIRHGIAIPGTPEHEPDPEWVKDLDDNVSVCDFCTAPGPVWNYPATGMEFSFGPRRDYLDDGEWYACDACYQDIEADRWPDIVQRSVAAQGFPLHQQADARARVDSYLRAFIKARSGPPTRIHAHSR